MEHQRVRVAHRPGDEDIAPRPWIPIAIVVGGAIVAAGVYLGFRGDDPPSPPRAADRATVEAAARAALEARREHFVRTCWTPDTKRAHAPAHIRLTFGLAFDADGNLVASSVGEGTPARPKVAECLRSEALAMTVPAPGAPMSIEIPYGLPVHTPADERTPAPFPPRS